MMRGYIKEIAEKCRSIKSFGKTVHLMYTLCTFTLLLILIEIFIPL